MVCRCYPHATVRCGAVRCAFVPSQPSWHAFTLERVLTVLTPCLVLYLACTLCVVLVCGARVWHCVAQVQLDDKGQPLATETEIDAALLKKGDVVKVLPGGTVSADGTVLQVS